MTDITKNISKRQFIKTGLGLAVLVAVPELALASRNRYSGNEVFSEADYQAKKGNSPFIDKLPPGIQLSTLPVQKSYAAIQRKHFKTAKKYIEGPAHYDRVQAGDWEFQNEPATYLCHAMYSGGGNRTLGFVSGTVKTNDKIKEPMNYWGWGIGHYVKRWVKGKETSNMRKNIEEPLLTAIFLSANKQQGIERTQQYLNASHSEKERLLKKTMKELAATDNYRSQLIASWSSFILTTHYDLTQSNLGDFSNKFLEKPLRKYTGKIRGKPYYGFSSKM